MSIIDVLVAVIIDIVLMLRCDSVLASKDSWPSGSYSLPKPLSGCPKLWKEGWLKQDLEDDARKDWEFQSKFSSNFKMDATIIRKEFVERTFCTKVANTFDTVWIAWPKGSYCIYRKHESCPQDMVEGSIFWDDEDNNNLNHKGGSLPDLDTGYFGTDTILYYCCQNQGEWYTPIELPTEKPFYLLPYESRNCQRVKWAISSLEYIIYDTEDNNNFDQFIGHHVFTDEFKSLPKIFYCYYKGCQYKLQNDNGSFSSPNVLNNSYPDFQVCSWSVTVNASLRILLKLQTINIPNCEENYLDIYDGRHDNPSTLLARFCGKNATSGAKVTSKMNNLYIVLKSGNNYARNSGDLSKSLGFYAEYDAFEQATTTKSSRTMPFTKPAKNNTFPGGETFSRTMMFTKPTNTAFYGGRKEELQNANSEISAIYLSIILPILVILILLGVVGAIFYWRRHNKENNVATQAVQKQNQDSERFKSHTPTSLSKTSPASGVTSKASTNPIYDSGENAGYEHNPEETEMHSTTDNVLYEPANELWDGINPIYEGIDNNVDSTYAEPFQ